MQETHVVEDATEPRKQVATSRPKETRRSLGIAVPDQRVTSIMKTECISCSATVAISERVTQLPFDVGECGVGRCRAVA
jgi:predicted RNA-binding Zn-ribbon protein involved in translation (DUF1610 family)